ncbi:hypothetical protein [Candidatus Amarobacter glycogenicus]|uniref:hypothetical protein n=1 Tax=Candidatus Amarobacter glycogenicus TaxID=3140699 RepID=UPI002A0EEC30|nr:hypothetical protein [Dehalococcoidia bacterium]
MAPNDSFALSLFTSENSVRSLETTAIEEVLGFFEECKRLCARGSSIILILHSHALNSELLVRIRSLCDAHLQLRTEEVGKNWPKTLQ